MGGTAFRAFFSSADLSRTLDGEDFLIHVKALWEAAPICTSVPITFWQRYLCRLAKGCNASAAELIRKWMPLAADRSLPGELCSTMRKCGWTRAQHSCSI